MRRFRAVVVDGHSRLMRRKLSAIIEIASASCISPANQRVMENPEFRKQLEARIPLGRIADPKDIVGPALFFAAPASGFVTGQILYVDGGITASQ